MITQLSLINGSAHRLNKNKTVLKEILQEEKKMKLAKFLNTTLAMGLALSLGACSSSTTETTSTADAGNDSASAQHIIIATSPDFPPYESLENGEIVGFEVDMIEWLFNWMNENGYNYTYEWKQMSFDTIISAIQTNQVDLGVSGFTYDEKRQVTFSEPFYALGQVVIVNADSGYTSADELKDKKLGAQSGTTGETCAQELSDDVTAIEDASILMETLKAGSLDGVVIDSPVANEYAANGDYVVLPEVLLEENNYVITAEEGKEDLMAAINEAITAFKASDDYDTFVTEWFGA